MQNKIDISSVISFGEASDEGFEQLFPFLDNEDDNFLSPIQFATIKTVRDTLNFAQLTKEDILCDIGCGDGRIVLCAFFEFNIRGAFGIEIDHNLAQLANKKLQIVLDHFGNDQQERHVKIISGDFFQLNEEDNTLINSATIYILYLLPDRMKTLEIFAKNAVQRGSRIVTIIFPFLKWKPIRKSESGNAFMYDKESIER